MTEQKRRVFTIHNTSRDPRKKELRRHLIGPDRSKRNLTLGGGVAVVRRGRPLTIGEPIFVRLVPELITLEGKGLVEVFDARSQPVNLKTFVPVVEDPPADPPAPPVEPPADAPPPPVEPPVQEPPPAEPPVVEAPVEPPVQDDPPVVETPADPEPVVEAPVDVPPEEQKTEVAVPQPQDSDDAEPEAPVDDAPPAEDAPPEAPAEPTAEAAPATGKKRRGRNKKK